MALDTFSADEHFPTPIERKQEEIIISETRNNLEITLFLQDFPGIEKSLNRKQSSNAFAGPNGVCSYALDIQGNGIGTYAGPNGAGALTIKNWKIIYVR